MDRHVAAARLVTGLTSGHVLEVGPGPRGLAPLLLGAVRRYDALDRSPRAVARLRAHLAAIAPAGAWSVHEGELTGLARLPDPPPPSDVVVAVDVNAFWTAAADTALAAVRAQLAPGGALVLVLEPPDPVDARVRPALHAALARTAWRWDEAAAAAGTHRLALVTRPVA